MTKRIRYVTPIGTALFTRLNTPSVRFKPEGEYLVTLLVNQEEATPFIKLIEETAETYKKESLVKQTLPRVGQPYQPYIDKATNTPQGFIFKFYLRARVTPKDRPSFTQRPALFDAKGKPIDSEIWAGSRLRIACELNPWQTHLGWGVSLWVKAAQVITLVNGDNAPKDGAAYGFDSEEGYESFPEISDEEYAQSCQGAEDGIPF